MEFLCLDFWIEGYIFGRGWQNTMCCLECSGLAPLLGVRLVSGGSTLISRSGGRRGSYFGSSSGSSDGSIVSKERVSVEVFTCWY